MSTTTTSTTFNYNQLCNLKARAIEAKAIEQFAYETLQEVRNAKNSDANELDTSCQTYFQAVKASHKAEALLTLAHTNLTSGQVN